MNESMNEPRNFGLTPRQTLSFVADPTPPPGFTQYWTRWRRDVWTDDPAFSPRNGPHGVTHEFRSLDGCRIGARITTPENTPEAIVVTSHGYGRPDAPLDDRTPWTGPDHAVVQIRFRGYPGSDDESGDLTAEPGGYITRGLDGDAPEETWIMRGVVADLVNAVRAARARFGAAPPIFLHGESFGGGVAVLAASQLVGLVDVPRIALGVPTLGAWPWRFANPSPVGAGADIARFRDGHPEQRERLDHLLHVFDAVVHARRIVSPAVCKLAVLDEVVPAPSAAAVFNALGSDPGRKWRFVTRYGHFDGGVADLRRHSLFEQLIAEFFDPTERTRNVMRRWEDRLNPDDPIPA